MTRRVIVVIPAYNEAARFDASPFLAFLAGNVEASLVFVNDGSTDTTAVPLAELKAAAPDGRVDVVTLSINGGKAEAVRGGLLRALATGATYVGFADADLAAPLDEMAALVAELDRHPAAWAAIGSRVKLLGRCIERSELRHYLGRLFATCSSTALQLPVYDTQCGLKLFRNVPDVAAALQEPFLSSWIFDVELIARLADRAVGRTDQRIREVPLEHWEEQGSSRLSLADFVRAPLELFRIRRRMTTRIRPRFANPLADRRGERPLPLASAKWPLVQVSPG